ncbi:MAG: Stp1/IreP family PP2C-type Ser/Thr phosphatase [candidate division Zixibacteria bacterium]|nr:Stp1/IreP family PP2C-type Ser/Thr phosphatase [candidate division Zixibacteria bacterium]
MPLKVKVAGKTDKGLVRSGNEDYLHLDAENNVFAVCDGMGGHQAGEVASMLAADTIQTVFSHFNKPLLDDPKLDLGKPLPASGELLTKAIRLANRAVYNAALEDPSKAGMGTTVVATAFEADFVSVAHVGDSRAYRLEEKALVPLTKDHSWIQEIQDSENISQNEASSFVGKNVITRALGVRGNVEVDYRIVKVKPGDIFILCSDGLCGFADDDEIFEVARKADRDIEQIVEYLVQMANDRGGQDNVTVIALEVTDVFESPLPDVDVYTLPEENEELLEIEDDWLAKIKAFKNNLPEKKKVAAQKSESGGNRLTISLIFMIFIIIAVLIIYFSQR